jgi:hypothetical protein
MPEVTSPTTLRRIAGAFALAHVVLFAAASALTGPPVVHDGQEGIEHSFQDGSLGVVLTAGYLTVLGFLVLIPAMSYLARHLGQGSEPGRWAGQTALASGLGYVIVVAGTGFAAGGAAMWGRAHGMDLDTAVGLNNVRNFAYFIGLPFAGLFALGTGIAALADGSPSRWLGWGGVGAGAALLVAVPVAALGVPLGMPVWLVWWLGVGLTLLRSPATAPRAESAAVRHHEVQG